MALLQSWFHRRSQHEDVLQQIDALRNLKPGWNTYRAGVIEESARAQAIEFVRSLAGLGSVPAPTVTPTPNGGVALRWLTGKHEAEIIFLPRGGEYMVAERGSDDVLRAGDLAEVDPLKDIVKRYVLAV